MGEDTDGDGVERPYRPPPHCLKTLPAPARHERWRNRSARLPSNDLPAPAYRGFEITSTINEIPLYSYDKIVKRSSTVDVIWFNERQMPDSFFEVEHSTDIQNSLLKFLDLQDLFARMIIVADKKRKQEFVSKLGYSAFVKLASAKRVRFLDYDALIIVLARFNRGKSQDSPWSSTAA